MDSAEAGEVTDPPKTESLRLEGNWIQGGLLRGRVPAGHTLEFLGRQVPVAGDGAFVLGLGRDFPANAELTLIRPDGERGILNYTVVARDYHIQRIEGVPARTVNPDPEDLERIRRDARLVRESRGDISRRQDFRDEFIWPLVGPVTGVYGSQRFYNGEPRRPHYGVDVAAPVGTGFVAPASGRVVLAVADMFYSGGTLILDHGHGLSSTFLHLHRILVNPGEEVRRGQTIGEVGATGRATGPHLDWRMNWFDQRVDPQLLVPSMESVLPQNAEHSQKVK